MLLRNPTPSNLVFPLPNFSKDTLGMVGVVGLNFTKIVPCLRENPKIEGD